MSSERTNESAGVTISGEAVGIIQRLRAELDAAEMELSHRVAIADRLSARLLEAERVLREIERHPHQQYDHPENGRGDIAIGIADGHRCAASLARAYFAARRERAEKE